MWRPSLAYSSVTCLFWQSDTPRYSMFVCHPNAGVTVKTIGNPSGITAMARLVERSHEQLMMS